MYKQINKRKKEKKSPKSNNILEIDSTEKTQKLGYRYENTRKNQNSSYEDFIEADISRSEDVNTQKSNNKTQYNKKDQHNEWYYEIRG
jgi:hypothetical protein